MIITTITHKCTKGNDDLRKRNAAANMPERLVEQIFDQPKFIVFVFEICSMAHVKAVIPLARELAQRGHRIAYASPHFSRYDKWFDKTAKTCPFSEFITTKTSYEHLGEKPEEELLDAFYRLHHEVEDGYNGWYWISQQTLQRVNGLYEGVFESLNSAFSGRKPDLIVCDWLALGCFDYCKKFKIPYVITTSHSNADFYPVNQLYIPPITSGHTPDSLGYFDRMTDLFVGPFIRAYNMLPVLRQLNKIRTKLGVETSYDWSSSFRRRHIFVSNYFGLEPVRYMSPFVHMVGPVILNENEAKVAKLDADLKAWLDDIAENRPGESVVFMAFGSLTHHKPSITRKLLTGILFDSPSLNVENDFPTSKQHLSAGVHLLWASGGTAVKQVLPNEVISNPGSFNLRIVEWAPQIAVLNHPAVKLFVTHGGAESQFEASRAAKPVLVYPGFYDQAYQATKAVELGYGDKLTPKDGVTSNEVRTKATRLLGKYNNEPGFRKLLDDFAKIVFFNTNRPELAADVVEMELTVGSEHIRVVEDEWPLYKLYFIDVLAVPILVLCLLVYLVSRFMAPFDDMKNFY